MAYRRLLLPLLGTDAGRAALATAFVAARIWRAHVHALHVRVDPRDVAPLAGEGLSGAMIEEMMAVTEKEAAERAKGADAQFRVWLAENGIADTSDPQAAFTAAAVTADCAVVTGREEDVLAQEARLADLVVVAHPGAAREEVSASDTLHAVLFDSGRPVLVAPAKPPETLGTRICIGWNGSAQSASAVASGLPWLERAQAVRILSNDDYQRRGPSAEALRDYLAWHDIKADVHRFGPVGGSGPNALGAGFLAAAREFDCDLIVMGAYTRPRLQQMILGGVTRHVLEHAQKPLLMSR
jgi:nucleotide-binding universal stress UspA family protein